jgi:hypothetical protein
LVIPFELQVPDPGVGCLVNQAWELRFCCVLVLACNYKLILEKGYFLSRIASLPVG